MMLAEVAGFYQWLLILTLIGLGPAVWLVSPGDKRLAYSICLAPAIGFTLIAIVSFPLARFVGPVQAWAGRVTVALILVSSVLTIVDWRRNKPLYQTLISIRSLLWAGIASVVCSLILISPLVLEGIQYTIYRGNYHDAVVYMSLAETLRVADWEILLDGLEFTSANTVGLSQLAQLSPTALFSARFIEYPFVLNNMSALAWAAQLLGEPIYRFYYVYHLVSFMLVFSMSLVIGDLLKLPRALKYLGAITAAVGFWARFVLERDASYQISGTAAFIFLVAAWIQFEQESPSGFSRSHVLFAIAGTGLIVLCLPIALIASFALASYFGLGLIQRVKSPSVLFHLSGVAFLGVLFLTITGQIDFIVRGTLYVFSITDGIKNIPPEGLGIIESDGFAAIWGLPSTILLQFRPSYISWPIGQLLNVMGAFLVVSLLITMVFMFQKSAPISERVIVSIISGSLILSIAFVVTRNYRGLDKIFTYVYPYLAFGLLVFIHYVGLFLQPLSRKIASSLLIIWTISQCIVGFYLPTHPQINYLDKSERVENYDLSPIETYLDQHQPRSLLVNIPRTENWVFAYFSMLVFSRFPSYFQSGLIIDNNIYYQNLWLQPALTTAPDYAVMLKSADYVGPEGLGMKVAETDDLALYRITVGEITVFNDQETLYREAEATKLLFPSLVPQVPN